MKTVIHLLFISFLIIGCNSVKRNQKFIAKGNYNQSISLSVKKLQKDKTSEKNEEHIVLLEEAYKKAVDEDTRRVSFLKKEKNPMNTREIYTRYKDLSGRQEIVRSLLPLYSNSLGREAKFKMVNYTDDLITSKNNFLDYLYTEGALYMKRQNIEDYRSAYSLYCEIEELQANYLDVPSLIQDAHFYGTDFVLVVLNNYSGQLIPYRMERDLLDFNTYGLNDFWIEYHNKQEQNIDYNFEIALDFRNINISPERISEREERRSKDIKSGWKYKRNRNGDIINDEDGNPIKIDTYETVTAFITSTKQSKSVFVEGNVIYRNLISGQYLNRYPLSSEFIFENIFAVYRGDKRALTNEDLDWINNRFVYFPTNEQMVLDAAEDIKIRLKDILKNNPIR